ncbi:hypothetical protein PoB_004755500 [Plakobranchus ocellatus]|uniref:Uncharacterized protein n=1 Tax=Plakobranchus ocellatus TaxID=259542 RepID=A0AAV4BNK8_9GAST|nr:hypothetical protein PoB_004755500 [Plakobranchus ocellatus]
MGRVMLLLVLISVDVVVSEDFLARLRRDRKPPQRLRRACGFWLAQCAEQSLSPYKIEKFEMLQPRMANHTLMTQLGSDLQELSDCVKGVAALPICQSLKIVLAAEIDLVNLMAGYMNSPESIDKIVAASSSACVRQEETAGDVIQAMSICAMEQYTHLEADLCTSFSQILQCARANITQICGQEMGDLITSVRDYVFSPDNADTFLYFLSSQSNVDLTDCSNQLILAKHYVRAALPVIKQMRK